MSPRQIATVQNYIANGGNATAAASQAGYIQTYGSLKHTGSTIVSMANHHGVLQAEMEAAGIGRTVQLGRLSDVVQGRYQWQDNQTTYDADGNVLKSTRITRQPTARDITAAIATADRISGAREQRKVQADVVSAELKALIRKHCPTMDGSNGRQTRVAAPTTHAIDADGAEHVEVQADAPAGDKADGIVGALAGEGGIGAGV
jgi:hypothetical protein